MATIQPKGIVVHLTGQVAWDENEMIIGKGDVIKQTRQCFANIESLLNIVGGRLDDIISITTYFTDLHQLPLIQSVRCETFPTNSAPTSTSVMVAGLGHEDFLVEFTPIAVIPLDRYRAPVSG